MTDRSPRALAYLVTEDRQPPDEEGIRKGSVHAPKPSGAEWKHRMDANRTNEEAMKLTRRFQLNETTSGLRYQLQVDGLPAGSDDFLGIEESSPTAPGGGVLDLMIQRGVQRTTAAAFLWGFLEEKKQRQEAGGALFRWERLLECEE